MAREEEVVDEKEEEEDGGGEGGEAEDGDVLAAPTSMKLNETHFLIKHVRCNNVLVQVTYATQCCGALVRVLRAVLPYTPLAAAWRPPVPPIRCPQALWGCTAVRRTRRTAVTSQRTNHSRARGAVSLVPVYTPSFWSVAPPLWPRRHDAVRSGNGNGR